MAGIRIETGDLYTPSGTPFHGFKITVGGTLDPESVVRTYEDIEKIFKANSAKYKVHEEKRPDGKFKSYTVET